MNGTMTYVMKSKECIIAIKWAICPNTCMSRWREPAQHFIFPPVSVSKRFSWTRCRSEL